MMLFLRLAVRNIFRNRARTLVTLSAVGAGCAALILNGGIVHNIFRELREDAIHGRHGHLQIYRLGYAAGHDARPDEFLLPRGEADRITAIASAQPAVTAVTRRREFSGLVTAGDRYVPFIGSGVDPGSDAAFSRHVTIVAGAALDAATPYGVLVGVGLARKLDVAPGASLRLLAASPSGVLTAVHVTVQGLFQGGLKEYDDWTLKVPLAAASHLLGDDHVDRVVILVASTERLAAVRADLAGALQRAQLRLEMQSWHELALFHNQVVSLFGRELDVIGVVIATIVVLAIGNVIGMSIMERRGELGTLRAIGLRRGAVAALLVIEALVIGVLGGSAGLVLGIAGAQIVSAVGIPYPSPPGSTRPFTGGIDVVPEVVVLAFAVSVLASVAASALPVWQAVRRPVASSLRLG